MTPIEQARARGCRAIAQDIGLLCERGRYSCPACHVEQARDGRPPVGVRSDDRGWECHQCGAKGDAADLLSYGRTGLPVRQLTRDAVPAALSLSGLPEPEPYVPDLPRLDLDQLREALRQTLPAGADPLVRRWIEQQGWDPVAVSAIGSVRSLPDGWEAQGWHAENSGRYRLCAILYGPDGTGRAFTARRIDGGSGPRYWNPAGADLSGTWAANPAARQWLTGGTVDDVLVCEGVTDWIHACMISTLPVIGGHAGSFGKAADLPWDRVRRVWSATDADDKGDRYDAQLRAAVGDRYRRVDIPHGLDLREAHKTRADLARAMTGLPGTEPAADLPPALLDLTPDTWTALVSDDQQVLDLAARGQLGAAVERAVMAGLPAVEATAIRRAAESAEARRAGAGTGLAANLGTLCPDLDGLSAPPGYEIHTDGIYSTKLDREGNDVLEQVTTTPIVIHARAIDADSGACSVEIGWQVPHHGWCRRWVSRSTIADTRSVIRLAGEDFFPVTSTNAPAIVRYLSAFEAHNGAQLKPQLSLSRTGWLDHNRFALGRQIYAAGEVTQTLSSRISEGAAELVEAYAPLGDLTAWKAKAVHIAERFPAVHLCVLASVAAPLLDVLGAPSFCVEFVGATSVGKSTALKWGASVWGCPHARRNRPGLFRSWAASTTWIERASGTCRGLPLFLDDTKRCRNIADIQRIIYEITGEVGAGRGSVDGLRKSVVWTTVLLSTGEAPTTSLGFTRHGGAAARILSLWCLPWGEVSRAAGVEAEDCERVSQAHHGVAGQAVIRWLTEQDRTELLTRLYSARREYWTTLAGESSILRRAANYVAILDIAAYVLERATGVPHAQSALDLAWEAAGRAARTADLLPGAVRTILSTVLAQPARLYSETARAPSQGWIGTTSIGPHDGTWSEVHVLTPEVRGILTKDGYDVEATLRALADRGWVRTGTGAGAPTYERAVKFGPRSFRVVTFTREAAEAAGWFD